MRDHEFWSGPEDDEPRREQLARYNKRVRSEIREDDNYDPVNHMRKAHDMTLHELREGLTKAVTGRKEEALPLAIQIFNRIQDKAVKTTRFDDLAAKDADGDLKIDSINESLEKADILLNNSRSPIMSSLRSTGKYATQ